MKLWTRASRAPAAPAAPRFPGTLQSLDGSSADIKPQPPVDVKNGQIEYKLPPVSAALFVCGG